MSAPLVALAVLHTWTRALLFHPPVHLLVTAGGLAADGQTWCPARRAGYLLPQQVVANRVQQAMRDGIERLGYLDEVP